MSGLKIYVASSWRNEGQQTIVALLRAAGHEVYDFKNPGEGKTGFSWSKITSEPRPWSADATRKILETSTSNEGFKLDMDALKWCDACVMVQPCGRSAALELGWACGVKKITVALLADDQEPELMLKMADKICVSLDEVIEYLASAPAPGILPEGWTADSSFGPNMKRYEIASQPHASEADAKSALEQYIYEVSRLREKYQVPEVLVAAVSRHMENGIQKQLCQSASFGDQRYAPELAAELFGAFAGPIVERARRLESIAMSPGEES